MIDPNAPAFPWQWHDFQPHTGDHVVREQGYGLTIREYIAIRQMAAINSRENETVTAEERARWSVEYADALIKELNKK